MWMTKPFFDTNIVVYFVTEDIEKAQRSKELLTGGGVISVQVLNEFARVARGKRKLSFAEVRISLEAVRSTCDVVDLTVETHERGLAIAERYQLQIFDSMIVAAALLAGCTTLYSEDMHDGLVIDGLTIRNPYRPSGPA